MHKDFVEGEIDSALRFIHDELEALKLSGKDLTRSELVCEESLLRLMRYADFDGIKYFRVRVRKSFGNILIDLSVPGEDFDFAESLELPDGSEIADDSQEALQNLIFRSYVNNISFRHSRKFNTITITALTSSYSSLYKVLTALALAVVTGLSMRAFLPDDLSMTINNNIFSVITEIFINGLKMCALPVIFFSIILCFSDMGSIKSIKRAGAKLFSWFIFFQVTGVFIGFGLVYLFGTGKGAGLSLASGLAGSQEFSISFRDTVINLMPDNVIKPFLDDKVLQLVTLAILTGIASGLAGAKIFLNFCGELNAIFMKVTSILIKFVPVVIFSSISSMIITAGLNTIISFAGVLFVLVSGYAVLNIIFSLAVRFYARLSPIVMYKKLTNVIITAFSTCSSNAAIPDMMNSAAKMGISKKFYPFAISLATSTSKPAYCLYMSAIILSVANMYGLNLSFTQIISLAVSIIILIFASPVFPGAGPAQLSIMFIEMGLPLDLLAPIIAVSIIEDVFETPTHCVSVITSTLLAAGSENLIDIKEYNKP